MKNGYIYIMTNRANGTLYTGVTSDLILRVYQHKQEQGSHFTKKYKLDKLVYFELLDDIQNAIEREKQIKANSRAYKISLISSLNPNWNDLFDSII
jgi:putative endonuclease